MAYEPTIAIRNGYVLVTHESGEGSNTDATTFAAELADACDQADVHRVLLDERKLVYTVGNIFDLMGIGDKLVEDMLVFRFHRIACVTTPEQLQTALDFEAVGRNRGMNYRAFGSIEEAETWLLAD